VSLQLLAAFGELSWIHTQQLADLLYLRGLIDRIRVPEQSLDHPLRAPRSALGATRHRHAAHLALQDAASVSNHGAEDLQREYARFRWINVLDVSRDYRRSLD
jgi:hypothetical protein